MIIEVANAWCLLLAGALVLRASGMRGWGITPLAYLVGICMEIGWGFVQAFTPLPGSPLLTWALMLTAAGAGWLWRWRSGDAAGLPWLAVVAVGAAAAGAAGLFRWLRVYSWHIDSLEYVQQARLLARGHFISTADGYVLDKRLIAFPILEGPAQLGGGDVLFAVLPLLAIATLGVLAWFVQVQVTPGLRRGTAAGVMVVAVLALGTINRFVANAFYVNGHLLAAALLLLAAGACWLVLEGPPNLARPMLVSLALAAPALVLVRPEGIFLAALAAAPAIVSPRLPLRSRRVVAVSIGGTCGLWYGFVGLMGLVRGEGGEQALAVALAGITLVGFGLALPFIRPRAMLGRVVGRAPAALDWGLWVAFGLAILVAPRIVVSSVGSLILNAGAVNGVWGLSFDLLVALVGAALILRRGVPLSPLRAVVTGFLPVAFLLAWARGSAYRVAVVDSLNRMLIEVVPVAVLLVVAIAAGRERQPSRTTSERGPRAVARSEPR